MTACMAQASGPQLARIQSEPAVLPWGVIVASNRERDGAERQAGRCRTASPGARGEPVSYTRGRRPGHAGQALLRPGRPRHRAEADALCGQLRAAGGDCMVLRN